MQYTLHNLQSARLQFRLVQDTDLPEWLEFFGTGDAAKFVALDHLPTAEERAQYFLQRSFDRYKNNLGGLNALRDKQTGALIGQAGLIIQDVDGEQVLEVGYHILQQHRMKGYAIEAARACRDYAFEQGFADALVSIIHTENVPSMRVAMANGMQLFRSVDFKGMPVHIFRITREEWEQL